MEKQEESVKTEETKKKKSAGKIIIIVLIVILAIVLLCGVGGFFLIKNFVTEKVDEVTEVQDVWKDIEKEFEGLDDFDFTVEDEAESSTYPTVDGELLDANIISDQFPGDISLSGGKVTSSSFDEWRISVSISTSSSLEEAFAWYEDFFESDPYWTITSKSKEEQFATMQFTNSLEENERKGSVTINSWFADTNIEIIEDTY